MSETRSVTECTRHWSTSIRRNAKIKEALRAKSQEQAKSYLRSRRGLEELLVKRTGASETLGSVLIKIEQAAGDAEIVAAYDLSADTLKKLLADPSLQTDAVEKTMNNLADAVADQREMDEAIRAPMGADADTIDEDEILKELEQLEKDEKKDKKEEMISKLPDVPTKIPEVPTEQPAEPVEKKDTSPQPQTRTTTATGPEAA